MHKSLLALSTFLAISTLSLAQQVAKSGGTSNSTFLLGNVDYARKSQLLYLPGDLTGEQPGTITRVYFKRGSTGTTNNQTLTDFVLSLGQTTQTGFSASTFFTGLTPVVDSASITFSAGASNTWFSIDLDVPFEYDPTRTLIVETSFETSTQGSWGTLGSSNTPVKKIIAVTTDATTGSGTSSTWQDFGFDLGPVAVSHPMAETLFRIYPNPVTETLFIALPEWVESHTAEVSICNAVGKEVWKQTLDSSYQIEVSQLPAGIYQMIFTHHRVKVTSRFVKE